MTDEPNDLERLRMEFERAAAEELPELRVEASVQDEGIALYAVLLVREGPAASAREISLEDAHGIDPGFEVGDEVMVQIFFLGSDDQIRESNALQPVRLPDLEGAVPRLRARYADLEEAIRVSSSPPN